jgi:hypothetical protein
MAAQARNDAPPALGVLTECLTLERIDLVADKTGDLHESLVSLSETTR